MATGTNKSVTSQKRRHSARQKTKSGTTLRRSSPSPPFSEPEPEPDAESGAESSASKDGKTLEPARKKAKHAPAKKARGKVAGAQSFTKSDESRLLDILEKVLPIGANEWVYVETQYTARAVEEGRKARGEKELKKKYVALWKSEKPTGDPECPENVKRAKRVHAQIEERIEMGDVDDGNDDEEENEGTEDEDAFLDDSDPEAEIITTHDNNTEKNDSMASEKAAAPPKTPKTPKTRKLSTSNLAKPETPVPTTPAISKPSVERLRTKPSTISAQKDEFMTKIVSALDGNSLGESLERATVMESLQRQLERAEARVERLEDRLDKVNERLEGAMYQNATYRDQMQALREENQRLRAGSNLALPLFTEQLHNL